MVQLVVAAMSLLSEVIFPGAVVVSSVEQEEEVVVAFAGVKTGEVSQTISRPEPLQAADKIKINPRARTKLKVSPGTKGLVTLMPLHLKSASPIGPLVGRRPFAGNPCRVLG